MLNILFRSAGRRVELLRWFRKGYRSLGLDGRIVATGIDSLAAASPMLITSSPCIDSPDYELSWEDRFRADVEYVERMSFLLDVQILLKTVLVVMKRTGNSEAGHATKPDIFGKSAPRPNVCASTGCHNRKRNR